MKSHERSWEFNGRSKECQWKVMGGKWGVLGGQWEVIGDHLEVRCSLSKAMGISRSEILRKKKKKKNRKWKSHGRSWEVNEESWEVKGWSLEITWRLDAHCQKKWASLGLKFSGNKNTKCPIDAHCHRHCRRDPRISKDFKDWIGVQTQLPVKDPLGPGAPHESIFVENLLRLPPGLLVFSARASCSGLKSSYSSLWAWSSEGSLRSSKFMCDTKPKEVFCP